MKKCRLCKTSVNTELPDSLVGINPDTYRMATMHLWCFRMAYEDLETQKATDTEKYENRKEEYDMRLR
jgi:hypothetical protein